ncbi:hypothetical protein ACJX0J_033400, partial [Zea mays]
DYAILESVSDIIMHVWLKTLQACLPWFLRISTTENLLGYFWCVYSILTHYTNNLYPSPLPRNLSMLDHPCNSKHVIDIFTIFRALSAFGDWLLNIDYIFVLYYY